MLSKQLILQVQHLSDHCSPFERRLCSLLRFKWCNALVSIGIKIDKTPTSNSEFTSLRSSLLPTPTWFLHLTVLPSDFFSSTSGNLSSPFQMASPVLLPLNCSCQVVECSVCRWLQERVRYAKVQSAGEESNLTLERKEERESTLRLVALSNKALLANQVSQEG